MLFGLIVRLNLLRQATGIQLQPAALSTGSQHEVFASSDVGDLHARFDHHSDVLIAKRMYAQNAGTQTCEPNLHFFSKRDCRMFQDEASCVIARSTTTFLASFPCSGNTWTRIMLQQLTGIYTGSVYHDQTLESVGLPEGITDPSKVLIVKSHYPVMPDARPLHTDQQTSLSNTFPTSRAIVLMRSPLKAALSLATLLYASKHGIAMPHSASLSPAILRKVLDTNRDRYLREWKAFVMYWFSKHEGNVYTGETLVVHLEDLVGNASAVLATTVLPFLGIDVGRVRDGLACATTANVEGTHRNHTYVFEFTEEDKRAMHREVGQEVLRLAGYDANGDRSG